MPSDDVLYLFPGWLIATVLLILCIVVAEMGFRVGRRRKRAGIDDEALATVEGAMLGLLALVIAFTYSMASGHFATRRQLVLDEANAIGTAELRARLMPGPDGEKLRRILREFVDVRIDVADAAIDQDRVDRGIRESNRLLDEAWQTTEKIVASVPPTPIVATLVLAVNEVIDTAGKRVHALREHVPEAVILLLMLVSIGAVGLVGHCVGSKGIRSLWTSLLVPAVVVAFLAMTIDLDRPRRGWITVSQQSMLDLQQSLRPR